MARTINTLRQQGCQGKAGAPALAAQPGLHVVASRIQAGQHIKSALADASYRSVSTQAIQLGGHRSVASIRGVLASKYCEAILNATATELGIGGSVGSVTVVLAKPFLRGLADPQATLQQVLQLVNVARATGGMCGSTLHPASPPLALNPKLNAAAQAHADDMAERSYYSHQSQDGRSANDRMRAQGYQSAITAENIAAGQQSAEEVVAGWLKSAGHCRNILMPDLREIGLGVAIKPSSERGSYWVQNFGAGER